MAATTCLACACTFDAVPAKLAAGQSKYCSQRCRVSMSGYRKQVRDALPGTIAEIAARSGVATDTVRDQLVGLQRRGEAHASRLVLVPAEQRGRGEPAHAIMYEPGSGGDPDAPLLPRAALSYFYRQALLAAMPGTQTELVARTGLSQGSTSRAVGELHGAGRCRITSWRRGALGGPVPVYTAGAGVDRICRIAPYSPAERSARYIKRLEKRGLLGQLRARSAADQRMVTMRKRGDPLVTALFGRRPAATKEVL